MTKDNVDDDVAYNNCILFQFIINPTIHYQSLIPQIFQLNKPYNINNIIIFGVNYVI